MADHILVACIVQLTAPSSVQHLGFVANAWCAMQSQVCPDPYDAADIHDPFTTVHEALRFSAHLRINDHPDNSTVETFVEEVMGLVELEPLRC